MKTKLVLTGAGLVLIALIAIFLVQLNPQLPGAMTATDGGQEESDNLGLDAGPFEGMLAPCFTAEDLEGNKVSLEDLRGRPVIINFWATLCPYCIEEMPALDKALKENKDLVVLAVNIRENKTRVRDYLARYDYSFTVLLDTTGRVAGEYLVRNLPTTFFVDTHGKVRVRHVGMLQQDQLRRYLNLII